MVQIFFFVPRDHAEKVKAAMFHAGAGKLGPYDQCCFEHLGEGQFRPLEGSHPFLGKIGEVERVEEIKIEMVSHEEDLPEVIKALKKAHPYETPAYYALRALEV